MAVVYITLSLILFLVIKVQEGTIRTPISLFVLAWSVFPAINSFRPCGLYELSLETHFCILLSLFSFVLAYYAFKKKQPKPTIKHYSEDTDSLNVKVLIILNAGVAAWLLTKISRARENLLLMGMAAQRDMVTENFGDTIEQVIYGTFAQPIVFASLAILSVLFFRNKKINLIFLILVFANIGLDVVVFAARATLIKFVFYVLISFFFLRLKKYSRKQKLGFGFIIAAILFFVILISEGRNEGTGWGVSETFVIYYIAPFNVLDYYINHPAFSQLTLDKLTYGTCMFGGLYNFIPSGLYVLFHTPYFGTDHLLTQVSAQSVDVAPNISMNAACTADYAFLKDFSYLGIIIGFSIMAWLLVKIKKSYERCPSIRHAAFYVFFIYEVFRLSIYHDFLFSSYVITFFVIWFLTRRKRKVVFK